MSEMLKNELKKTLKSKKNSILADESTSLKSEMEYNV